MAPPDTFALHELRIDRTVLLFTALIAVVTGVLFGLIPAAHGWKENVNEILNRSTRGVAGSSNRLRAVLVVAEIALSLVLVVGAGLMIRSLVAFMNTDLGFRADHLLVMRVSLPKDLYNTPAKLAAFNNRLIESVRNVSGIRSAALTSALPMKAVSQSSFEIPGRPRDRNKLPVTDWARVSDGYFETLKMRLLQGRTFTRQEAVSADPNVAVVNQAFANKFFPNLDALGKQVIFANEHGTSTTYRIVGVVANERQMGPDHEQDAELYMPGQHLDNFLLAVRTAGDPLDMANAVKQQVWNIDKDQPVKEVMSEEEALHEWSAPRRFNLIVLVAFAVIALALAAMGLYSVLAYTVALRIREIGIRVAIGAEPKHVARYVLRNGLALALTGVGIGLAAALALTRYMSSLIFGVSAFDPLTFAGVACLLVVVAAMASYIPAIRAAKIDPIEALRVE
jgi:predicted permease